MESDKIISIDLNDPRMKYISEIFGNESCKKILNLIADKELTETEISKKLNMPLNSVDYNIKKLIRAGLIKSSGHWWSTRGKKMPSYRVSDKKIIISPKRIHTKVLLIPALLAGGAISFVVKKLMEFNSRDVDLMATKMVDDSAVTSLRAGDFASEGLIESAPVAGQQIFSKTNFLGSIAGWEWFLIGIWSGVLLFLLLNYFMEKRK